MTKQQRLDDIQTRILEQNICPDLASQATQLVFGAGNVDADLVFIGEAPGKNEDLRGVPFVGAAGKFLDEMLGTINLTREDIYITNIVKYRPPNNRDPLPEEKAAFLPFLHEQLEVIKPKLIVTLGRHSMDSLLPGLKISEVHGQPKKVKLRLSRGQTAGGRQQSGSAIAGYLEVIMLPLYHPAAALYNGGMRQTLIDDFMSIPLILQKIN